MKETRAAGYSISVGSTPLNTVLCQATGCLLWGGDTTPQLDGICNFGISTIQRQTQPQWCASHPHITLIFSFLMIPLKYCPFKEVESKSERSSENRRQMGQGPP